MEFCYMRGHIVVLLVASLPMVTAQADQPDGMAKYRNYTPAQLEALTKKEKGSAVPMAYLQASGLGSVKGSELIFASQLNTLMYPGVGDYPAAVKAFQADLGDEPTGVLTVGQIYELGYRVDRQRMGEVNLPFQLTSYLHGNYAEAKGALTLAPSGENIAWPVNYAKVSCYKDRGYCRFDQIYLVVPDRNSWGNSYTVGQDTPEFFDITRWGEETIEAISEANEDQCRTLSLSLSFKTKEFFYITKNGSKDCDVLGTKMPRLEKPRVGQLVDGLKIQSEFFAKLKEENGKLLSSAFQQKAHAWFKEVEAMAEAEKKAGKQQRGGSAQPTL